MVCVDLHYFYLNIASTLYVTWADANDRKSRLTPYMNFFLNKRKSNKARYIKVSLCKLGLDRKGSELQKEMLLPVYTF